MSDSKGLDFSELASLFDTKLDQLLKDRFIDLVPFERGRRKRIQDQRDDDVARLIMVVDMAVEGAIRDLLAKKE